MVELCAAGFLAWADALAAGHTALACHVVAGVPLLMSQRLPLTTEAARVGSASVGSFVKRSFTERYEVAPSRLSVHRPGSIPARV